MVSEADEASSDQHGVQVVARAAAILRYLGGITDGRSLAEIAKAIDLPRTTVHRLVRALEEESFVTSASGGYRLGPGAIMLANAGRDWLIDSVHPTLVELSRSLRETVDLAVLRGDRMVFIDQIAQPQRLQAVSGVGISFALHSTANGKAILATLSDDAIAALLPRRLDRYTPNTITTRDRLRNEIADVRRSGLGWDREENDIGIGAVGAAIPNPLGVPCAFAVPVPASRFYGREPELAAAALTALDALGTAIR